MFSEMLKENEAGNWVNPTMEKLNSHNLENFMIKLNDFKWIHESLNVSIYSISKLTDKIIIHCKQDFHLI